MTAAYKLRIASPGDHASIFSDWLRSARSAATYRGIPSVVYFYWGHLMVEALLADVGVTWLVACASDDPTKIYGWLCGQRADAASGDQAIVHYVYVKKLYRRVGIASRLMAALESNATVLVATSMSESGKALLHDRTHIFNPFLLFTRVPAHAPKYGKNHPINVSRRNVAEAGFDPAAEGEEP